MPLYLREADVAELLTTADALAAVEGSFRRLARGAVDNRPRDRLPLALCTSGTATLEAAVILPVAIALMAGGIEFGRVYSVSSTADKSMRDAARYLARANARSLGVIGCGWQAASQIASIREALPSIERVVAYCRNAQRLDAFCRDHDCEPAGSHREAAEHEVVVTVTTSKDPVLRGDWLQPGTLVCAVGANDPRRRELDNAVLERAAFVCCDSRDDSRRESGDLIEPVEQGILDWLEVHELQEVVAGDVQGRASDDDLIVFKSNGIAAWDLAAGARVVELARERGAGLEL